MKKVTKSCSLFKLKIWKLLPDGPVEAGYSTVSPMSVVASVILNEKILPLVKVNNKNTVTKLDTLYLFIMILNSKEVTKNIQDIL